MRFFGAGFFVAALARLLSMRRVGRPHPFQQVLMALEFGIPVVIVPWQRRVARSMRHAPG